jgi:hypothetical protein
LGWEVNASVMCNPVPSIKRTLLMALFCLVSSCVCAQDLTPPIPERLVIHSAVLAEDRVVFVRLPQSYAEGKKRYPVLYLTDGDSYINEIGVVIDFLASNDRMPELIVVGITHSDRYRDLTPTRADITKRDGTIVFRVPTSGGASDFLKFLDSELVPFVEKRYRTEPFRILVGHSLGGLFALDVFLTKPNVFQGYISASPTLEWDNEIILARTKDFLAARKQLKATIFFAYSDEGTVVPRFKEDFDELRRIFGANSTAGLEWDSDVMTDEDHGSGVLRAHYAGLRRIFAGWQMPKESATQLPSGGVSGIEEHYAGLSRRFGYTISSEHAIADLGYQLLAMQKPKEALAAFQRNIALYPNSANAYNSLADGYEAAGQTEMAKQNVRKAIELATKDNNPQLAELKKHLSLLNSAHTE